MSLVCTHGHWSGLQALILGTGSCHICGQDAVNLGILCTIKKVKTSIPSTLLTAYDTVYLYSHWQCLYSVYRYFLVGPTAQQTRSYDWMRDHLPADGSVQLSDVTSMYTALDVIGPKAKELLAELTDTPLGKQDFPHMTCRVRVS